VKAGVDRYPHRTEAIAESQRRVGYPRYPELLRAAFEAGHVTERERRAAEGAHRLAATRLGAAA
jgi:hypothetical protein